jgi:hypothetical protein
MKIIPGEAVVISYPEIWPVNAFASGDPAKALNQQYSRANPFDYVSGDPNVRVELMTITGQAVTVIRPTKPDAPKRSLLSLAPFKTILGKPKAIIQNRLTPPTKNVITADGLEAWHYHHEIIQNASTTEKTDGTVSGFVGENFVQMQTTDTTTTGITRAWVLWDFTIVFDKDGKVTRLEQGKTGAGEWHRGVLPSAVR